MITRKLFDKRILRKIEKDRKGLARNFFVAKKWFRKLHDPWMKMSLNVSAIIYLIDNLLKSLIIKGIGGEFLN